VSETSDPPEIEECTLQDVYELAAKARDDGNQVQHRPDEQWYRIGDLAIACLWWPQNRRDTARLSHCWVTDEARGDGLGEALVRRRIEDAKAAGAGTIDTYAYREELFTELGFKSHEEYNMGTTHMTLELEDETDG